MSLFRGGARQPSFPLPWSKVTECDGVKPRGDAWRRTLPLRLSPTSSADVAAHRESRRHWVRRGRSKRELECQPLADSSVPFLRRRRHSTCKQARSARIMATILHSFHRMRIPPALTRILRWGVLLYTILGSLPSLVVAASSLSDPPQTSVDCEDWQRRHEGADPAGGPCGSPPAFRAEEDLSNLRREQEEKGLRWQPLEPSGRDLSLWYYPGAPRPLWGY